MNLFLQKLQFFCSDFPVTSNQIERLWSRFTSLDKQQKGYLTREDFLRIPELAINPLGDRIVHAFFRDGRSSDATHDYSPEKGAGADRDVVNFCDFVRVLAHFRPLKKNLEKNKLNSRQEKLKCKAFLHSRKKKLDRKFISNVENNYWVFVFFSCIQNV